MGIEEVVIAVLGAAGVGKSTFLQLSLDLKKVLNSPIASKKVSREGSISAIQLIELNFDNVEIAEDSLRWPELIAGQPTPAVDGVLLLYNVLDPRSTAPIPPLLSELAQALLLF